MKRPKNKAIWVRVTTEEHRRVIAIAHDLGYQKMSRYVRDAIFQRNVHQDQEFRVRLKTLKRIIELMEMKLE